jgi:hypothetical protein
MKEKKTKMAKRNEPIEQSVIEDQPQVTEDEIGERAYEIYCARNGGSGDELDDWLKAEAELRARCVTTE